MKIKILCLILCLWATEGLAVNLEPDFCRSLLSSLEAGSPDFTDIYIKTMHSLVFEKGVLNQEHLEEMLRWPQAQNLANLSFPHFKTQEEREAYGGLFSKILANKSGVDWNRVRHQINKWLGEISTNVENRQTAQKTTVPTFAPQLLDERKAKVIEDTIRFTMEGNNTDWSLGLKIPGIESFYHVYRTTQGRGLIITIDGMPFSDGDFIHIVDGITGELFIPPLRLDAIKPIVTAFPYGNLRSLRAFLTEDRQGKIWILVTHAQPEQALEFSTTNSFLIDPQTGAAFPAQIPFLNASYFLDSNGKIFLIGKTGSTTEPAMVVIDPLEPTKELLHIPFPPEIRRSSRTYQLRAYHDSHGNFHWAMFQEKNKLFHILVDGFHVYHDLKEAGTKDTGFFENSQGEIRFVFRSAFDKVVVLDPQRKAEVVFDSSPDVINHYVLGRPLKLQNGNTVIPLREDTKIGSKTTVVFLDVESQAFHTALLPVPGTDVKALRVNRDGWIEALTIDEVKTRYFQVYGPPTSSQNPGFR